MEFEWDDAKDVRNGAVHGVEFSAIYDFDWITAITAVDDRRDYGETRFISIGFIQGRLYVCVYTQRREACRIISLRKANKRERILYEEEIKTSDE